MRLLNTARLGLALITILVTLVAVAEARADQPPSSTIDTPASAASVAVAPSPPSVVSATPAAAPPAAASAPSTPPSTATPPVTAPTDPTPPSNNGQPTDTTPPSDTTPPADTTAPTDTTPPADTAPPADTTTSTVTSPVTPPSAPSGSPTPPTPATPAGAPSASTPSSSPPPAPAQVPSSTTVQTIIQIQISGCTSNCQDVSQTQQATQSATNLQTVGASAEQAGQLEAPAPATTSQPSATITQMQIGCLAQCFGTTTTSTTPQPVAEQILAALSSLVPLTSTGPQTVPGVDQTVIDQVSCQVQTGEPAPGSEAQTATQTSTTVQLIYSSSGSQPTSVGETDQQTWQLQIGCLFYCTDTQQIQQAQQTIATIQVVVGPPGSSTLPTTGAAGAVSQVIWQLQIGCIAWCYDATQVQDATSQTTVTVIVPVPPAAPSPPSPPPSPPPADTTGDLPPAPTDPAAGTPSTPTPLAQATATTALLSTTARVGIAILDRRPPKIGVVAPGPVRSEFSVSTVVVPASRVEQLRPPRGVLAHAGRPSPAQPHRDPGALGGGESISNASLGAVSAQPGSIPLILFVALALAVATALWEFGSGHRLGRRR